jgi:hypothetical protein
MKDVVPASEASRTFHGNHIGWPLDDAQQLRVAARVLTQPARIFGSEAQALGAQPNGTAQVQECLREALHFTGFYAQQMERQAHRCFLPDAGQLCKLANCFF